MVVVVFNMNRKFKKKTKLSSLVECSYQEKADMLKERKNEKKNKKIPRDNTSPYIVLIIA